MEAMKRYNLFLTFFIIITCSLSCSIADSRTSTPKPEVIADANPPTKDIILTSTIPTATLTFTPGNTPTTTRTVTPTFLPTKTPTSFPKAKVVTQCVDFVTEKPTDFKRTGILVLTSDKVTGPTIFLDLKDDTLNLLPQKENEWIRGLEVSPNRKFLAYHQTIVNLGAKSGDQFYIDDQIIIIDTGLHPLGNIPYHRAKTHPPELDGSWESWYWLDNEHLVIDTQSLPENMLIINPFTGEEKTMIADYPVIDLLFDVNQLWDAPVIFNPSLSRAVYIGAHLEKPRTSLVLLDVLSMEILLDFPTNSYYALDRPRWSPDEKQFAYAISSETNSNGDVTIDEIFIVDDEGNISQVTDFENAYGYSTIGKFSWSPTGEKIAFWWRNSSESKSELAIVDVSTHQVTTFCLQEGYPMYLIPPIWSPDGEQLLVAVKKPGSEGDNTYVVLVDPEKGIAIEIAQNMIPAGWMVSP